MILAGQPRGAEEADALVRRLAELGPRQVVIKRGRLGSVALIDDELHCVDGLPVRSVDPVGAGDAFVGGYLAELMLGRDPATRLATATATGAFAVTVSGDWEGLPHRDELALLSTTDDVVR
jgi:2-dehydro-3-deoxygluconokinase